VTKVANSVRVTFNDTYWNVNVKRALAPTIVPCEYYFRQGVAAAGCSVSVCTNAPRILGAGGCGCGCEFRVVTEYWRGCRQSTLFTRNPRTIIVTLSTSLFTATNHPTHLYLKYQIRTTLAHAQNCAFLGGTRHNILYFALYDIADDGKKARDYLTTHKIKFIYNMDFGCELMENTNY